MRNLVCGPAAVWLIAIGGGWALAEQPVLSLPIDCRLGVDCFVQQFVDHDPGAGVLDYACGKAANDGHKGTDFRVPTLADMARGVDVLAAADGKVVGLRDGMIDRRISGTSEFNNIQARACGNGVVVVHGDGWRTQYCHMKRGSISVEIGDVVRQGAVLGQVGLSGSTSYPHVHLAVYKDEQVVDPFVGAKVNECSEKPPKWMWNEAFSSAYSYQPTQVLTVGFTDGAADYQKVLDGAYDDFLTGYQSRSLVAFGFISNVQINDIVVVRLHGPLGIVSSTTSAPFVKPKAQWMSFTGRKSPEEGWPPGRYWAEVTVLRKGRVVTRKRANIPIL